jgi:hypothetical protein
MADGFCRGGEVGMVGDWRSSRAGTVGDERRPKTKSAQLQD